MAAWPIFYNIDATGVNLTLANYMVLIGEGYSGIVQFTYFFINCFNA